MKLKQMDLNIAAKILALEEAKAQNRDPNNKRK